MKIENFNPKINLINFENFNYFQYTKRKLDLEIASTIRIAYKPLTQPHQKLYSDCGSTFEDLKESMLQFNNAAIALSRACENFIFVFSNDIRKSCIYDSQSVYLKCAVNPSGDCTVCPHFTRREGG